MQNLYYTQASASLALVKEGGAVEQWSGINSLIVCSSLSEIIAFSGSTTMVAFPIDGTNVYYNNLLTSSIGPPGPPLPTGNPYSRFITEFKIVDVADADTGSCSFSISSSATNYSASGYSTQLSVGLIPNETYKISVTGSGDYTSYLWIYDTTDGTVDIFLPGVLIAQVSQSNAEATADIYVSASRNYATYLQIVGNYAP